MPMADSRAIAAEVCQPDRVTAMSAFGLVIAQRCRSALGDKRLFCNGSKLYTVIEFEPFKLPDRLL
jgi:hypoxanthine phosphoribosyltransferase